MINTLCRSVINFELNLFAIMDVSIVRDGRVYLKTPVCVCVCGGGGGLGGGGGGRE